MFYNLNYRKQKIQRLQRQVTVQQYNDKIGHLSQDTKLHCKNKNQTKQRKNSVLSIYEVMSNEVEQNLIKIVKPILIGYIEGNMLKQFLKLDKDSQEQRLHILALMAIKGHQNHQKFDVIFTGANLQELDNILYGICSMIKPFVTMEQLKYIIQNFNSSRIHTIDGPQQKQIFTFYRQKYGFQQILFEFRKKLVKEYSYNLLFHKQQQDAKFLSKIMYYFSSILLDEAQNKIDEIRELQLLNDQFFYLKKQLYLFLIEKQIDFKIIVVILNKIEAFNIYFCNKNTIQLQIKRNEDLENKQAIISFANKFTQYCKKDKEYVSQFHKLIQTSKYSIEQHSQSMCSYLLENQTSYGKNDFKCIHANAIITDEIYEKTRIYFQYTLNQQFMNSDEPQVVRAMQLFDQFKAPILQINTPFQQSFEQNQNIVPDIINKIKSNDLLFQSFNEIDVDIGVHTHHLINLLFKNNCYFNDAELQMVHGNLHLKDVHLDDMKTEILNSMTEHKVPLSEIKQIMDIIESKRHLIIKNTDQIQKSKQQIEPTKKCPYNLSSMQKKLSNTIQDSSLIQKSRYSIKKPSQIFNSQDSKQIK